MVSATSTGRPPWAREFIRRPASRMKSGTAAVIFVSMKPGATALTVTPCSASARGARERTRPMMPALLAA